MSAESAPACAAPSMPRRQARHDRDAGRGEVATELERDVGAVARAAACADDGDPRSCHHRRITLEEQHGRRLDVRRQRGRVGRRNRSAATPTPASSWRAQTDATSVERAAARPRVGQRRRALASGSDDVAVREPRPCGDAVPRDRGLPSPQQREEPSGTHARQACERGRERLGRQRSHQHATRSSVPATGA